MSVSYSCTSCGSDHLLLLLLFLTTSTLLISCSAFTSSPSCFTAVFCFGDSLSDAGNQILLPAARTQPASRLPYGETFFGEPTGRYSDGRIIPDFLAQFLWLPLVPPYFLSDNGTLDYSHGANFAVAGARAISNIVKFQKSDSLVGIKGLTLAPPNYGYLSTQIDWFKQLGQNQSLTTFSADFLSKSLIFIGEIGINDYNRRLGRDGRTADIRSLVPGVMNAISSAIINLIPFGAKTIMVEGMFPMGCIPLFLTKYQSQNSSDYDPQTGCLQWLNDFSVYHNTQLQEVLAGLRQSYPDVNIIYADIYGALMSIYQSPQTYGIDVTIASCCGTGGAYNVTPGMNCGDAQTPVCSDPSKYVNWDGAHLTEAAYRLVTVGLLKGPYTTPPFNQSCSSNYIMQM